ncbi:MAG: hypothetical protein KatS3mg032_1806 [Cyclobacteriaceae bacterium]|nr:MAG: hypothetical protein KatS3mg032_1806 [Cyclobacteriaceae bacterium]
MMLTDNNPIVTAMTVVNRYRAIVRPPIRDSLLTSESPAMPSTSEKSISGMAMSLSELINKVPQGFIQLPVKVSKPSGSAAKPHIRPIAMAISILAYRGMLRRNFIG